MRNLVADFRYEKGHTELNRKLIEYLSTLGGVDVIDNPDGYYQKCLKDAGISDNIRLIRKYFWNTSKIRNTTPGKIIKKIIHSINMILQTSDLLKKNYDNVIVFTYDTFAFALGRYFLRRHNVYLFDHGNIDELVNKIKLPLFKTYRNKVNHIVFAEYMKEHLVREFGVAASRVFVLPHPLNENREIVASRNIEKKDKLFVGVSFSNDEDLVKEIMKYEKKNNILGAHNCRIVLKSKVYSYESEHLKVFNRYLEREELADLFAEASGILVLYPETYQYRMSGVIMEALSNGIPVVGRRIPIVEHFASSYPHSCTPFANIKELYDLIINKEFHIDEEEVHKFQADHSDQTITKLLKSILDSSTRLS
jgi:glycosyltransferase involved in cell wall biosynthesis